MTISKLHKTNVRRKRQIVKHNARTRKSKSKYQTKKNKSKSKTKKNKSKSSSTGSAVNTLANLLKTMKIKRTTDSALASLMKDMNIKECGVNRNFPIFQKKFKMYLGEEFVSPHQFNNDCCPCVFKLLGLTEDDVTNKYVTKYGEIGMRTNSIIRPFESEWPEYNITFQTAKSINLTNSAFIDQVFCSLKPGYGTLMGWMTANNTKHCFVFANDANNVPLFMDAQTREYIRGIDLIQKELSNMKHLYSLFAFNKNTGEPLVIS